MQTADSINVILLDALNTPTRDQTYVHSQMIKYLEGDSARHAGRDIHSRLAQLHACLQGVTTDLLGIVGNPLNSAKAGTSPRRCFPSDAENEANQRLIDFMD